MNKSRWLPVLGIMVLFLGSCGKNNPTSPNPEEPFDNVSKIIFISNRGGTNQIYVMHTDGSQVKKITPDSTALPIGSRLSHPQWSPDSRQILFSANQWYGNALFVMNYDGRHVQQVDGNSQGSARNLGFMPTRGEAVLFLNTDKAYTSNLTNFTTVLLDDNVYHAQWFADGSRVLYARSESIDSLHISFQNLYSIIPTGADKRAITTNRSKNSPTFQNFSLSPDGKKIAFIWGSQSSLYVMNADGTGQMPVANFADYPIWSPDGTEIFYVSTGTLTIHSMNADGSNQNDLGLNVGLDSQIRFSKDGQQVFYYSNRSGNGEIFSVNSDGSHAVNLTNHSGEDGDFDLWFP